MARAFATIAFTPDVRAQQSRMGSAETYGKLLSNDAAGFEELGTKEISFIGARDGFYQASVSQFGWPYVQFRGGPVGFLKVLTSKTLAYADFRGNRQYISAGNLSGNDRLSMILMDYPNRRRLKLWGRARLIEGADNPEILSQLHDRNYTARPERGVLITVEAFDWNCPSHIPRRFTIDEANQEIAALRRENEALRAETHALRTSGASGSPT
ncbi:pyridoxamine 5'-phosphate oxidase family protein [uncultured Sulfitobacter sp.]|uniref:pyridoxamine 5'-phosphate oxidase family protein n=1 Tax=uncultured Sulfitobacter sp. TaxID=191468 RepID=UPI00262CC39E|nr:pyridoxamine 5'-phosphate oxidase family protein [uncultured Sulfitobacter sp.]